jgi:hypothetical protein
VPGEVGVRFLLPRNCHLFRDLLCLPARNQPRVSVARQVAPGPLDRDQDTALKLHDVQDVDEQPRQPADQARHVESTDLPYRRPTTDGCQAALIMVAERTNRLAALPALDKIGNILTLLHSNWRNTRQRLSILVAKAGKVTDHEDVWRTGHAQIRVHDDAPGPVELRADSIGNDCAEWGRMYARRP